MFNKCIKDIPNIIDLLMPGFRINGIPHTWSTSIEQMLNGTHIWSDGKKTIDVTLADDLQIRLVRTPRKGKAFVGVYIVKDGGLSWTSDGIIGNS